jgi:hypothetical protein
LMVLLQCNSTCIRLARYLLSPPFSVYEMQRRPIPVGFLRLSSIARGIQRQIANCWRF